MAVDRGLGRREEAVEPVVGQEDEGEKHLLCAGAKNPLSQAFMERQRGLLKTIQPYLPEDTVFQQFINEGSCNFYGAPTAVIISLDQVFSSARLTDMGVLVGYLVLAAHALVWGPAPSV